jgi:uncharacterized membrane protein YoaK (UPF0700 family)
MSPVLFFVLGVIAKGESVLNRLDWSTKIKLVMVELCSVLSVAMLLAWLLWEEYKHLFRK